MAIRALVMSGGGSKGAFEAGAVDTLVNERGLDFDVIAGVSAGALNALVLAQGAGSRGLRQQVQALKQIWLGIRSSADVYRNRFLGKVLVFAVKDSMYDPEPLRRMMRSHAQVDRLRASGREFRVGVSWLETGQYECVGQDDDRILDCALASGSVPLMFPPVRIGGRAAVDGGVRTITPLENAFDALKQLSEKSPGQPLEMYVLLASPLDMADEAGPWSNGLKIGRRALSMLVNEILREDLAYALAVNEAVRFYVETRRRIEDELGAPAAERLLADLEFPYRPPEFLHVAIEAVIPDREFSETLDFDPEKIRTAYEAGRAAARQTLGEPHLAALLRRLSHEEKLRRAA